MNAHLHESEFTRAKIKWAKDENDVLHFSRIGQECLKALIVMTAMRPYLAVTLRDKTVVRGWLGSVAPEHNATEATPIPTAWRAVIVLRDDVGEIELDFLEIDSVQSAPAPIRLLEDFDGWRAA